MGTSLDIVKKNGAWFSYGDQRIGQGRENVKRFLRDNPEIMREIEEKIKAEYDKAFLNSIEAHAADEEA